MVLTYLQGPAVGACDSGSYELADGACCTDGLETASPCIVTNQVDCEEEGGLFRGPGTDCVPDDVCTALLVTMEAMSAVAIRDGVLIRWTTAREIDTIGFRVLRGHEGKEKALQVLTPHVIPSKGSTVTGASYAFLDNERQELDTVLYYIEDIDLFGKVTRHGPVTVDRGAC